MTLCVTWISSKLVHEALAAPWCTVYSISTLYMGLCHSSYICVLVCSYTTFRQYRWFSWPIIYRYKRCFAPFSFYKFLRFLMFSVLPSSSQSLLHPIWPSFSFYVLLFFFWSSFSSLVFIYCSLFLLFTFLLSWHGVSLSWRQPRRYKGIAPSRQHPCDRCQPWPFLSFNTSSNNAVN